MVPFVNWARTNSKEFIWRFGLETGFHSESGISVIICISCVTFNVSFIVKGPYILSQQSPIV